MLDTPDACNRCGGAVYTEDTDLHIKWHDDIDKIVKSFEVGRASAQVKR